MSTDFRAPPPRLWIWSAFLVSAVAVAGSLYLTLGMELIACPLCFYQRAFAMSVFGVVALGLMTGSRAQLGLLALPLSVAGLGVAGFHNYLVLAEKLECPDGIFGVGSAPMQSAIVFLLLTLVLIVASRESRAVIPGLAALVLGGLFALGCIVSAPPPKEPDKPYPADKPINTCRPPYRSS